VTPAPLSPVLSPFVKLFRCDPFGADVPVGVHTIAVQARITTVGSADTGSFQAFGTIGKGTMTVESVRLIRDPDVIVDVP